MNQNLGETVAWASETDYGCGEVGDYCSSTNKGPITALNYLESQTSSWTNIPLETYQVIDENDEYSPITRTARARMITHTEATELGCQDFGGCQTWLFENGGNYWTSSVEGDRVHYVFIQYSTGGVASGPQAYISSIGIRPVITISKTIL